MDLNGDGQRDVVSGSYPGEIYLFAGDGKGGFRKAEKITDASGEVLKVGRATAVHVVDWEGDGDLDLIVGDIEGRVSLVANESGGAAMKFGEPTRLAAQGEVIRTPGRNSGPVVADWDGDGRHDLIVGCGDGSVLLYRNAAEKGAPVLAKPVTLVGTSTCGSRSKLAVHDWNGDGRDDLLLGDFSPGRAKPPVLTKKQTARRDELRAKRQEIAQALGKLYQERREKVERTARKALGLDEETPLADLLKKLTDEERQAYHRKASEITMADPEYRKAMEQSREVSQELGKLEGRPELHGYVWLFLRGE